MVRTTRLTASTGYITPVGYSAATAGQIFRSEPVIPPTPVRPIARRPILIPDRGGAWRLMGAGGLSAQNAKAFTFSGQLSVRVSSWLEIVAEGGQFADVMPPSTRSEINATAAVLTQIGSETIVVDARVPATFGMAGARFISDGRGIRPYVQATGGLAMLSPRVDFMREGQRITGIAGATFQVKSNNKLVGLSGGILLPIGSVATVDVGYRIVRALGGSSPFTVNQAILGLGTRF